MKLPIVLLLAAWTTSAIAGTADPLAFADPPSPLTIRYLRPTRILWSTPGQVDHADTLMQSRVDQATLPNPKPPTVLHAREGVPGGVLIDFGREINGGIEIFTPLLPEKTPVRVRVRFGESAAEAMADLGGDENAGNDHAMRDLEVTLPWLGRKRIGDTGFRFVRIDSLDPAVPAHITGVRAYLRIRDIPYLGSFRCSDPRLDSIWSTGAYTVHLNMQDYLWDGVKRDRLVWMGDMHPEVRAIAAVFGRNPVVEASLDLSRDVTPLPDWMCGISSYSMWWILIHEEWLRLYGDRDYLEQQRDYLVALLTHLADLVDADGREVMTGNRFLDWPTAGNEPAIHAGLQSLLILTLDAGGRLSLELEESDLADRCDSTAARLRTHVPDHAGVKQPAALMVLAGLADPATTGRAVLLKDGSAGLSTFYGYYVLEALALAGNIQGGLDLIREYWGGMLDLGATTFWEHFDIAWKNQGGRIDELPTGDAVDVHGSYGDHCYIGYRHSLCHGWAAGPTAWLTEHVLGIRVVNPRAVTLKPNLGDLDWAEGTYPTPLGILRVRHDRRPDGRVETTVDAPPGLAVLRETE